MRQHFKILVEYDPGLPVQMREDVDKKQMGRLLADNPGFKIVNMSRKLISDYRVYLYAVLERKMDNSN